MKNPLKIFIKIEELGAYWLYMLTTGVWRVLVRYLSVTVCIFQSNFSLRKRDRKFELFWLENESVTTWHRREFSRNICSNDHETPFLSSSNTQFELILSTRTRSSVGMGKSLVMLRTVDRTRERVEEAMHHCVPNLIFLGNFFLIFFFFKKQPCGEGKSVSFNFCKW